jgi:hypothetical protein
MLLPTLLFCKYTAAKNILGFAIFFCSARNPFNSFLHLAYERMIL